MLDEHMDALRADERLNALFWGGRLSICAVWRSGKRGGAFIRCVRGRSKRCSCIECDACAYAPELHAGKSKRKGVKRWQDGSTAYRAPTGRRRLNESCVGKRIETCKKIEKMARNDKETQKGIDPWQRAKGDGGRFAKVGVI